MSEEVHEIVSGLIRELEGWQYADGTSDDARRKIYLMRRAAFYLRHLNRTPEVDRMHRLLTDWGAISKGFRLYNFNGTLADHDMHLAGLLARTARETLEWRDGGGWGQDHSREATG